MSTEREVKINFWVTKDLRNKYKMYCIQNDIDMSKHLREFIEQQIKKTNNANNKDI
jgi:hypothetical protein